MKRINFCLLLLLISIFAVAQGTSKTDKIESKVKVKNWGQRIYVFPPNYWDNKHDQIVAQIGDDEFENVKKFSHHNYMPKQMQIFDGKRIVDSVALNKKMSLLNLHLIATFTHITPKGINRGRWAILRAPYMDNTKWDTTVKWDTVYFVINISEIEYLNK
jgi:hypothetical protein